MEKEIWKDIPEYEGLYQASNLGKVRSVDRGVNRKGRELKFSKDSSGYFNCNLHKKGKQKTYRVHKIIAITFLGHKPCGYIKVIDHIDNNKENNRADNLQIITHRENASKDKKNGTSKYTGVHWSAVAAKWYSQIRIKGKVKYLGLFRSEEEAHFAYQKELNKIKN